VLLPTSSTDCNLCFQADKQSKGVFTTILAFHPEGMSFSPDEGAVLEDLTSLVDGLVSVAHQAPRLLFMRAFSHYFDGKPVGINPLNIIRSTPLFQELRQKVTDTIVDDYAAAREYIKVRCRV
jgi:dynein heavy chain, axonemal